MTWDENGDSRITMEEVKDRLHQRRYGETKEQVLSYVLTADPSADGHLTADETRSLVRNVFQSLDSDGNGRLSKAEAEPVKAERALADVEIVNSLCQLPIVPDGSQLEWVTASDGLPTTVTVAGQYGVTKLNRIHISTGTQKIYLLLTSTWPALWQFEGAVDRLSQVVVIPPQDFRGDDRAIANAGTIGLPPEIVTFVPDGHCAGYRVADTDVDRPTFDLLHLDMKNRLGRSIDQFATVGGSGTISVPDLATDKLAVATPAITVAPNDVLSPGRVDTYLVLPGKMGLDQLVAEDKLELVGSRYRIKEPISTFPAGLDDTIFLLPRNIQLPSGLQVYPALDPEN